MNPSDTIVALSSGSGGAIALIRLSGPEAIAVCDSVFRGRTPLSQAGGYTLHYGEIVDRERIIDDVVVSLFRAPRSYTGEDMVEISCHGSRYIIREIINLLLSRGARNAEAGEFTVRAFMAGRIDLSQAEAVADLIASENQATHALASNQMRGGYSTEFAALREKLITLASLLELELDFGEEDVEFADRSQLMALTKEISAKVDSLLSSFRAGNAIKEGISVALAGDTNVGKSTLLNALLKDDRAMVSDIAGTTRDVIEERIDIGGVAFRLTDTAGIRSTDDRLEQMGIDRTFKTLRQADIILLVIDGSSGVDAASLRPRVDALELTAAQRLAVIINKTDLCPADTSLLSASVGADVLAISAKYGTGTEDLVSYLGSQVDLSDVYAGNTVISNSRHYEALLQAREALLRLSEGLSSNLSGDLLSHDVREVLHHIGSISGSIITDDILTTIFSKFCIGK